MSTIISNVPLPQYGGHGSPASTTSAQETDVLSVCFCPHLKLLCGKWDRFPTSAELRQSIRLLARAVAILKAELMLVELPSQYQVSEEDQQWAKKFTKEALNYTSIKRVARIVPKDVLGPIQQTLQELDNMPYEAQLFSDRKSGLQWLLPDHYQAITDEAFIPVPLHFNLKLIRTGIKERGHAAVPVGLAQRGKPTNVEEPLPGLLTIETDFVSITLDKAKSLMNIRWKKAPQSRQYRYGMLKAARALIEHRLERLLLNNQRLGMLTLEDQGWLVATSREIIPKMNLRKLAVISSADALQQMSSENIGQKLKQAALDHKANYFLAEEDALEWLVED
ncbi:hypothetical protein [Pontibacter ramchanderi]|nr:hypothetical protein [Pontibacter ramchanderi]